MNLYARIGPVTARARAKAKPCRHPHWSGVRECHTTRERQPLLRGSKGDGATIVASMLLETSIDSLFRHHPGDSILAEQCDTGEGSHASISIYRQVRSQTILKILPRNVEPRIHPPLVDREEIEREVKLTALQPENFVTQINECFDFTLDIREASLVRFNRNVIWALSKFPQRPHTHHIAAFDVNLHKMGYTVLLYHAGKINRVDFDRST
jgi:hypothetical protein